MAEVIIEAPMSYTGSAKRIWRLTQLGPPWLKWALTAWLAVLLVVLAWLVVFCWYVVFGLVLAPYRLLRRGQRKQKRDRARHEELLAAARGESQTSSV